MVKSLPLHGALHLWEIGQPALAEHTYAISSVVERYRGPYSRGFARRMRARHISSLLRSSVVDEIRLLLQDSSCRSGKDGAYIGQGPVIAISQATTSSLSNEARGLRTAPELELVGSTEDMVGSLSAGVSIGGGSGGNPNLSEL